MVVFFSCFWEAFRGLPNILDGIMTPRELRLAGHGLQSTAPWQSILVEIHTISKVK